MFILLFHFTMHRSQKGITTRFEPISVLKGDLTKVKKHLKTLKAKMTHASRQDNKFQQDAQVSCTSGPICSKLTTSLVNDSLKFQT